MKFRDSDKSMLRFYDPFLLNTVVPLGAILIKLLMKSCHLVSFKGLSLEKETLKRSGGRAVYATWHQRIPYLTLFVRSRKVTAMVSQSRDGEYAARAVKYLGIKSVRGSSTRGGGRALSEMIQRLENGENGGMLADGPLGPARVAKIGTVVMACKARVPILPVAWGAERCWVLNSWDRFMIPKPFSRVIVRIDDPIWIPESETGRDREPYRKILEERLNFIAGWCDEQFGIQRPWRKVKKQGMPEFGPLEGGRG